MISEPEIALAASPRDWAQRLHRHLTDHGGARVRATVLHPHDALAERYDVLVVDDTTSFLSHRLLGELRRAGRRVVGVYDPDDPRGKGELTELGVDVVLASTAGTAEFLEAVTALAAEAGPRDVDTDDPGPAGVPTDAAPPARGQVTVVGGPPGGCGATEVSVALAAAVGRRGDPCVLVDADEVAPSVAQRLGLAAYPNLRVAVDAVEQATTTLGEVLAPVDAGRFWALPGLSRPTDWSRTRAGEILAVVEALARPGVHVLADVAHRVEDLAGAGGPPRYASTRALLGAADAVVGVGTASPVGIARLLDWAADVRTLAGGAPLHLALNRVPASRYKRGEVAAELRRSLVAASVTFLPADRRVEAAAWGSRLVAAGPFTRAIDELATTALPARRRPPGRRRGTGLRAERAAVT